MEDRGGERLTLQDLCSACAVPDHLPPHVAYSSATLLLLVLRAVCKLLIRTLDVLDVEYNVVSCEPISGAVNG